MDLGKKKKISSTGILWYSLVLAGTTTVAQSLECFGDPVPPRSRILTCLPVLDIPIALDFMELRHCVKRNEGT